MVADDFKQFRDRAIIASRTVGLRIRHRMSRAGAQRRSAGGERHLADVLMVATTEGMLHGVHGHTTHARPLVALRLRSRAAGSAATKI